MSRKKHNNKNIILLKVEMSEELRTRFKSQCVLIRKPMRYVLGRIVESWTTNQELKHKLK